MGDAAGGNALHTHIVRPGYTAAELRTMLEGNDTGNKLIDGARPCPLPVRSRLTRLPVPTERDDEDRTPLGRACEVAGPEGPRMVEALLEHGADPSRGFWDDEGGIWMETLTELDDFRNEESKRLVEAAEARIAAARSERPTAERLIAWASAPVVEADIAADRRKGGELINAGIDVEDEERPNSLLDDVSAGGGGKTALMAAAEKNAAHRVSLLLSKKADFRAPPNPHPFICTAVLRSLLTQPGEAWWPDSHALRRFGTAGKHDNEAQHHTALWWAYKGNARQCIDIFVRTNPSLSPSSPPNLRLCACCGVCRRRRV